MKMEIVNRQEKLRFHRRAGKTLMRHLISRVERRAPDRMWESVDLVLLDDAGIEPLHRAHFGKPGPTDVISFAYPPFPGESRSISRTDSII